MNILQVSTTDRGGGAENVAWNLLQGYKSLGHRSWLAVGAKRSADDAVFELPNNASRNWWARTWLSGEPYFKAAQNRSSLAWVLRRLFASAGDPVRGLDYWLGREDFRFPGTQRLLDLPPARPEIVHCHNLHGNYFDLRFLPHLSARVPVVLTLHDAWLMTGHCAHSFDCERWLSGCGRCPDLGIYPAIRRDATAHNWEAKRRLYSASRLWIAAPSRWLAGRAERSILAQAAAATRVIPNGIDLNRFAPGDRLAARRRLGVPLDATILVFPGINAKTRMWGDRQTLEAALLRVAGAGSGKPLMGIAVGGDEGGTARLGGMEILRLPHTAEAKMPDIYQAADIYVHAARADTFPTMVLEAQACGTPVIASAAGGIPEQIVEGVTGFLATPGDSEQMAAAIGRLAGDDAMRKRFALQAAERAQRLYGLETQTKAYLAWYGEIIEEFPAGKKHGSFAQAQ